MRIVKHNQSLFDVAISVYGDVSLAFELGLENEISLTGGLTVNQVLKTPEAEKNILVVDYFERNKITPATQINDAIPIPIGIEQMQIGLNFQIA